MDAGLKRALEAKVYAGERLTREDGGALFASDDLAWLGRLAHHRRTEINGDRVLFSLAGDGTGAECTATMPYGVEDLIRLREQQDRSGGVVVFTPLRTEKVAPAEALRTFAVSRLLLDNVPHLKGRWDVYGMSVAQLTLSFGADDLDGPADSTTLDDLLEVIRDAGFQPVERDGSYETVRSYDAPVPLAVRRSEPQKVWA